MHSEHVPQAVSLGDLQSVLFSFACYFTLALPAKLIT